MSLNKITTLAELEGYEDEVDMLVEFAFESQVPAICMNEGCNFTIHLEPDQDKGFCPKCKTNTVKSCLILEGLI